MSLLWVSLCLAFAGLLQTQAMDIPAMADFEPEQFAGIWHVVAMASNCPWFMGMKSAMKMIYGKISIQDNGDIDLDTGFWMQDKCVEKDVKLHMVKPGQYTESDLEHSDIRFVETDYTNNAMELTKRVDEDEKACIIVKLLAREAEIHPAPYERFKMLANGVGLNEDNMVQMPKEEVCIPGTF